MKDCPRCGSALSYDGQVQGGARDNNHHRAVWSCSECGWSSEGGRG